jgi:hypothetical protein
MNNAAAQGMLNPWIFSIVELRPTSMDTYGINDKIHCLFNIYSVQQMWYLKKHHPGA